jgi:hypothetical protein
MKKLFLSISFYFGLILSISAQNLYTTNSAQISFFSEARLENIKAETKKVSSVLNIVTKDIVFKVPILSFIFENGLMQEHFNENYMDSDKYPYATFAGKIKEDIDFSKNGDYKASATGKLTIHGISVERTIEGTIKVAEGKIELSSAWIVPVSDHKINIPNDKITNISQNISVKLNAAYEFKK